MTTAIANDSPTFRPCAYHERLWIAVLSGLIFLSYTYSGWSCPFELPTVQVVVKGHELTIELATTPETRSCGLSLRDSLPENRGMLFVYAEPEILTFWMKNTLMPLSIAFIDTVGRVVSIKVIGMSGGAEQLGRALLPSRLHEARSLFTQDALNPADGIALAIKQVANAAQQVDVIRPVIASAAAALERLDLGETTFPKSQDVLRDLEVVSDLADGAEGVRRLVHDG